MLAPVASVGRYAFEQTKSYKELLLARPAFGGIGAGIVAGAILGGGFDVLPTMSTVEGVGVRTESYIRFRRQYFRLCSDSKPGLAKFEIS